MYALLSKPCSLYRLLFQARRIQGYRSQDQLISAGLSRNTVAVALIHSAWRMSGDVMDDGAVLRTSLQLNTSGNNYYRHCIQSSLFFRQAGGDIVWDQGFDGARLIKGTLRRSRAMTRGNVIRSKSTQSHLIEKRFKAISLLRGRRGRPETPSAAPPLSSQSRARAA